MTSRFGFWLNMSGVWYVLFCRVCDPDLTTPFPFMTPAHRGHWAKQHTQETGHNWWHVVDDSPPPPPLNGVEGQ